MRSLRSSSLVGPLLAMMCGRTVDAHAVSVMPYLTEGVTVVDAGCGSGTVTAGIADAAGPGGTVVGSTGISTGWRSQVPSGRALVKGGPARNALVVA